MNEFFNFSDEYYSYNYDYTSLFLQWKMATDQDIMYSKLRCSFEYPAGCKLAPEAINRTSATVNTLRVRSLINVSYFLSFVVSYLISSRPHKVPLADILVAEVFYM